MIEDANGGTDTVQSYVDFSLGNNVEHLTLLGSAALNGTGNGLANTLTGNEGHNVLDGGAGVDTLRGGKGDDTYRVGLTASNALEDQVIENVNEGTDTLQLRGGNAALTTTATLNLGLNLENLDASGTGQTRLNLTGNALNNVLTGNAANNVLNGGLGADSLIGGAGNDTLDGGAGNDTLSALEDITGTIYNDTLTGDNNANIIRGGGGIDQRLIARGGGGASPGWTPRRI